MTRNNEQFFRIEELVEAKDSVFGKAYWTVLNDNHGVPWRTEDQDEAVDIYRNLVEAGRKVVLINVHEIVQTYLEEST